MLHIGENVVVAQKDIVLIMPSGGDDHKSLILLATGQVLYSAITSTTLSRRLTVESFHQA